MSRELLSRRRVIASAGLMSLGLARPSAGSVNVATAGISLAQSILSMSRESGSLDKKLGAIGLEIRAISDGVMRLAQIQQQIALQVAEVGQAIDVIPERTNSLALVNDVMSSEQELLGILSRSRRSDDLYRDFIDALKILERLSYKLVTGVGNFSAEPVLSFAGFSMRRASAIAMGGLKVQKWQRADANARIHAIVNNASTALAEMSSRVDAGQPSLPKMVKAACDRADAEAAAITSRWPEFTSKLLPAKFGAVEGSGTESKDSISACYRSKSVSQGISLDAIWQDDTRGRPRHIGDIETVKTTTDAVRLSAMRSTHSVPGGRRLYELQLLERKVDSHVREARVASNERLRSNNRVLSESPASILEGCLLYPAAGTTDDIEFRALLASLNTYNSWTALAGYRTALLEKCDQELELMKPMRRQTRGG